MILSLKNVHVKQLYRIFEIVEGLGNNGWHTCILGYADNTVILTSGKFPNTGSELLQQDLICVTELSYQSTKYSDNSIHKEERVQGT
jgi:hypothetical protein